MIAFNLFEGPLPGFFFKFPDMVYLDLAYNRFTGTLPEDIPTTMTDLQILFAENNQIAGSIPTTLGDLRMRKIHLDDNAFTGPIPTEFGQLNRLEQLYLHGNQLTGGIPSELSALTTLKEASFHFNDKLQGQVDKGICELQYQQKLSTISVDCANIVCECCTCGEPV
jgi:Leucine-rich repeat (LRR) protein